MGLFHIVEDGQAILRSRGVYRQAKVYDRNGELFAAYGGGFVGLRARGGTTRPDVSWEELDGVKYEEPRLGNLTHTPLAGAARSRAA